MSMAEIVAGTASVPVDPPPLRAVADVPTLPARHAGLLMAAVMGITICQFLDMTIANVALPHMQTSLDATFDTVSWVLTSFIIAGVLILPLTGWLSDRIGSRRLFLGAAVTFVVASMLCGAATSLTEMIIFRSLQGMASAFLGPLTQTIMFDINRPSKQARAMAIWGMVAMIAPISGPFLGGFLTETLNWRWVFYVNLPIGIPAIAIAWWLLPSRPIINRKLDVFGAIMLGLALGSLQLMLDRGQQEDWLQSTEIVVEILFSIGAFWVFYIHSRTVQTPLFDKALLRNSNFLVALAFMLIMGITNVALSSILPTMYQGIYGYSVMDTGLLMAPRGVGVVITMLICNRLIGRVDPRKLISSGFVIAAISMWLMTNWSIDMDARSIVLAGFTQGLGLGLIFVPANLMGFATLDPRYRTDGSTLMGLFRNIGSSFGISVIVTILARNMQTSHADIASNVTSFNVPGIDPASASAMLGDMGAAAMMMLNGEVSRQAAMVAYLDNFYMLFWLLLAFVPLSFIAKRPPMPGQNVAAPRK